MSDHDCKTCRHKYKSTDRPPCSDCITLPDNGSSKWEPRDVPREADDEKRIIHDPDEVVDFLSNLVPVERNCETCAHNKLTSKQEPCRTCCQVVHGSKFAYWSPGEDYQPQIRVYVHVEGGLVTECHATKGFAYELIVLDHDREGAMPEDEKPYEEACASFKEDQEAGRLENIH